MRRLITTLGLIGFLFSAVRAHDYVLAWEHAGPVSTFRVHVDDADITTTYKITTSNQTDPVVSSVLSFQAVTPARANLLTTGIVVSSSGWLTRGLVLPSGAATGGVQLVGPSGTITTQSDVKTTWSNGSIRFVIVTANITETGVYNVVDSTEAAGRVAAPVVPAAQVNFVVYPLEGGAGTSHSAIAPASMSADCWLDGPLVLECRDTATLNNSPSGYAQGLTVYFDRRIYSDGTSRVDVMVNNMQRQNAVGFGPVLYTADVLVNSVSRYTMGSAPQAGPCSLTNAGSRLTCTDHGLDHGEYVIIADPASPNFRKYGRMLVTTTSTADYFGTGTLGRNATPVSWVKTSNIHSWGARWRKTFAAAGWTEATAQMDFSPLLAAKALPSYLPQLASTPSIMSGVGARCWTNPSGNTVNTAPASDPTRYDWCWDALAIADHQPFMAGPGARDEIGGLIPGVYARYFVHRTPELRANMLRTADVAGGAWKVHAVHAGTNSMVDLIDVPQMAGQAVAANSLFQGGAAGGGYFPEIGAAHHPGYAYLPYLDTGDRYYKEEMKHWANWGINSFLSGRNGSQGLLQGQQVRGGAWALRDMANNANYLPDNDEHKSYFATLVQNNLTAYDAKVVTETAKDPVNKQWVIGKSQCRTAPGYCTGLFMNAYLTLALQHVIRQGGFTGGATARNYLADEMITFYADSGWRNFAGLYHHHAKDAATGEPFGSFADMYNYNFTTTPPGISPARVRGAPSLFLNPGRSPDYRLAVLVGVAAGRPNAQAAYDWLMSWPAVINHITLRTGDASARIQVTAGSQAGVANID